MIAVIDRWKWKKSIYSLERIDPLSDIFSRIAFDGEKKENDPSCFSVRFSPLLLLLLLFTKLMECCTAHCKISHWEIESVELAIRQRELWQTSQPELNKERGQQHAIRKRSVSLERNVETLVVADQKMTEFYSNEDIETYILTVMNMVSPLR